ncbi:PREDICTED: agamous-like MADS-box protein AGL29 [Camelina sativa]|uniref:Agamous-like MADS-box protein AGL29 n=1 Tax=Camelina sativa TaxID=90675 RepID=A0ABM0YRM7_CAMSA|nr:PREDICTED: agamous-like MADS-box protein AGL29 [Camelina sativa]
MILLFSTSITSSSHKIFFFTNVFAFFHSPKKKKKSLSLFILTVFFSKQMGRRKIKMEMVQDMNTRQVTFSKRRTGLFKKASELATLCNAELGIVVFSPGGKPFSYGKPDLDSVADRFLKEYDDNDDSDSGDEEGRGRRTRPKLKRMSERLDTLNQEIEAEKKRGEKAQEKLESAGDRRFKKSIEALTLEELNEYKDKLETVHDRVQSDASRIQASSDLVLLSNDKKSGLV